MKILLITQHFPPEKSGGTGRPFSLYKYLPEHGVEPVVLTMDSYGKMGVEADVYRARSIMSWKGKKPLFYNSLRSIKVLNAIIPTMDLIWERSAAGKAQGIFSSHRIGLVYATYPSMSAIRLGLKISKKFNIPLITEFRDGLIYEPLFRFNPLSLLWTTRFERRLIAASSAVITIGNELSRYFAEHYGLKNVHTVHNGYDRNDFTLMAAPGREKNCVFRVAHFGSLKTSRARKSSYLFDAIARLKKNDNISSERFELSFFGNFLESEKKLIADLGIEDLVKFHAPVSKKEGFRLLQSDFDALLFVGAEGSKTIVSSKLPEYLYLGKPIIGVCKGNEAARIIERSGTGEVCDFDVASIYCLLKKALSGEINFAPVEAEIKKFDRAGQAARISGIIKEVVAGKEKGL